MNNLAIPCNLFFLCTDSTVKKITSRVNIIIYMYKVPKNLLHALKAS